MQTIFSNIKPDLTIVDDDLSRCFKTLRRCVGRQGGCAATAGYNVKHSSLYHNICCGLYPITVRRYCYLAAFDHDHPLSISIGSEAITTGCHVDLTTTQQEILFAAQPIINSRYLNMPVFNDQPFRGSNTVVEMSCNNQLSLTGNHQIGITVERCIRRTTLIGCSCFIAEGIDAAIDQDNGHLTGTVDVERGTLHAMNCHAVKIERNVVCRGGIHNNASGLELTTDSVGTATRDRCDSSIDLYTGTGTDLITVQFNRDRFGCGCHNDRSGWGQLWDVCRCGGLFCHRFG